MSEQEKEQVKRLFSTQSHSWREAGLARQLSRRAVKRARIQALVLVPVLVGILVVYGYRDDLFGGAYETPVQAVPTADGFVIALPYGPNTDWLKNVVTRGSATIVHEGLTAEVDRPEIVPMSVAAAHFSPKDQRTHRLFRVEEALVVRHAEPSTASSASCTRTDRTGQRSAAAPTWT